MKTDADRNRADGVLERLAAHEHDQWATWARHMLENQSPENVARWREQAALPYDHLPEVDREKDRAWARQALDAIAATADGTVLEGRHLRFIKRGGWECVERKKASGIVAILAVTPEGGVLLVEQFRPPVGSRVIELPAGLAGDIEGAEGEALAEAARRELLEETGYGAGRMECLGEGPASAGLCDEIITFFRAHDLRRVAEGGGDADEEIRVHEVRLVDLRRWCGDRRHEGCLVDYKIHAALWMAGVWCPT
jgi:ADP-ribose pyrophosphatase